MAVTTTGRAHNGDIELYYETFGTAGDPPLLLVAGLGSQLLSWDEELCSAFVDRGFHVIRFDNRDVGLSTKLPDAIDYVASIKALRAGGDVAVPYLLSHMAADAVAVLDAVGVDAAHVVGVSMGGMIVQTMAIEHPDRVRSLTSIMSTTGDPDVGRATPEALAVLLRPTASGRDDNIAAAIASSEVIGSPGLVDPERIAARAGAAYDRCFAPEGVARQLLAINASGSRSDALRALDVPTLVVHGDVDPLIPLDGGQRTAEVIPGARLEVIEGMGHDLPLVLWPRIIEPITALAASVQS